MPNGHPSELVDIYREECAKLRAELYKTMHDLGEVHANAGLVVHALDCALALTEQLFIFLPEGTSLPPGVSTCKHNLDHAMTKIHRPSAPTTPADTATDTPADPAPSPAMPTAVPQVPLINLDKLITAEVAPDAASLIDLKERIAIGSPITADERTFIIDCINQASVSHAEQNERLRKALIVGAANIASLNDQAHDLVRAINSATQLVDGLIGEMAAKGVRPTPVLIALHNQFTHEMDKVFKTGGVQKHPRQKLIG